MVESPPEQRSEFGDWDSHEHFPERMSIPGFRRGSRWTSTLEAEGFFVLYELEQYETLMSKGYLDRLNAPTQWSTKMMPHHLSMVRSQCRVAASFGGGVATSLATIRLSPDAGRETDLKTVLVEILRELAPKPGLTGAQLLLTDTPKTSSPTTEQQIRGAAPQTGSSCSRVTILTWSRKSLLISFRRPHFALRTPAKIRRSATTGLHSL